MNTNETKLDGNIGTFITAGKARFTVQNTETGNRFTYRAKAAKDAPGLFFVSLLTGANNESDYQYIGFIRGGAFIPGGRKSRISAEAPSVKAFGWVWRNASNLPAKVEVHHEGCCGRCGRTLTVPESIKSGFGPECITMVAA